MQGRAWQNVGEEHLNSQAALSLLTFDIHQLIVDFGLASSISEVLRMFLHCCLTFNQANHAYRLGITNWR